MAQENPPSELAPSISEMDEDKLRRFLTDLLERTEVEQERLQHMTDVDFHVRDAERWRQKLVERQARRAAARTADEVRPLDRFVIAAEICYSNAQRWMQEARDDPAAYAQRMTPLMHKLVAHLQQSVDIVEARLEQLERERKEGELGERAKLKQRTKGWVAPSAGHHPGQRGGEGEEAAEEEEAAVSRSRRTAAAAALRAAGRGGRRSARPQRPARRHRHRASHSSSHL